MGRAPAIIVTLFLTTAVVAAAPNGTATTRATIDVAVDPRVELVCILFRLAGAQEFSNGRIQGYTRDIDTHFGPFKEHDAVKLVRKLRTDRGIWYDAPMSLAVHLRDAKSLDGVVPLDPLPAEVDHRWRAEDVRDFQRAARLFAEESRFEEFFAAHRELYEQSTDRARQMVERHVKLDWFDSFFGSRSGVRFHVVVGLQNGTGNYGVRVVADGTENLYCILGVWSCDEQGLPTFPASRAPVVIHEFGHSYVNPLVEQHYAEMSDAGEKLFSRNAAQMRQQAYANGRTVLLESVVRACVVRYRFANDGVAAGTLEALEQSARGFAWTGDLSSLLADFEKHRATYPTLEAFMPRIVRFFNDYAARLPQS